MLSLEEAQLDFINAMKGIDCSKIVATRLGGLTNLMFKI